MSTCFIADLHLSGDRPDISERFLHFLQQEAPKHQTLYILGDLFEVWLGDDLSSETFTPVLQALQQTVAQGTTIYVQQGNRDFLLRTGFEQRSGCQLIHDPHTIELDNSSILLTHGDTLCSEDHGYQNYRKWIRHPLTEWILLHLPRSLRRRIGESLRQRSDYDKQRKSRAIMDVTQATVEETMRRWRVKQLIHGHTHRPALHHFELDGQAAERTVLGDWDSDNNILIYRAGTFTQQTR